MKSVLVTGAGGGMGSAICRKLIEKGFRVYGLDIKQSEVIAGLCFIPCDVTKSDDIAAARAKISEEVDSLCAMIHTAGIYDLDSLLEMEEERMKRIFDINLLGVYHINKEFASMIIGGRIIIVTSELAPLDPLPFTGVYAVTKAGLEKYAYSLRMEAVLHGIKVSVIRPGAVDTGLLGDSTDALDRFCEKTDLYPGNADRFRRIVNSVESRSISAEKLANKVMKALSAKRPRFVYSINRNPLLLLLNIMPQRFQVWVMGKILKAE